ncbi:DUF4233 domain-containing protein [Longispora albida]|uniref:DUF4233 domain-containing protein n=1 Tax=Longispora albida TaxID=203523 RepID=UPI000362F13A|nr:DUF4233 domain-containing protein [Longispora albida]
MTGEEPMETEEQPSGLRNPGAAVRGVGAGTLVIEGIVLLLAIMPIKTMGGSLSSGGVAAMLVLSLLSFVLCGTLRKPWGWHAGTVLQVLVIACGLFQWSVAVVGVLFLGLWLYVLHVRKTVLGG